MLKSNHPVEQEELTAFLDGELLGSRARSTAAHLEECRDCQGLAADFQAVSRRMTAWRIEQCDVRLKAEIVAELAKGRPSARSHGPGWAWGLAGAGALTLLIVAMIMPKMMNQSSNAKQTIDLVRTQLSAIQEPPPPASARSKAASMTSMFVQPATPMIARTAQLTLTTREFDKARAAMEEILKRHQGYLGQLNAGAPIAAARSLEATLRIPANQLEAAMAELKKLGRVDTESQTGEEVTQQYVDLEARLANARNAEQRLTDLLRQRTGKLADVLSVELEIDRVRGEIEQMEAERKGLANRVDFATLNVKLLEDYRAQLQLAPDSILGRFRNAAVAGFKTMLDTLVGTGLLLVSFGPTLLLWAAILFLPARFAWKRLRARG